MLLFGGAMTPQLLAQQEKNLPKSQQITLYNGENYKKWLDNFQTNCELADRTPQWMVEHVSAYMESNFKSLCKQISFIVKPATETIAEEEDRIKKFWKEFENRFNKRTKTQKDLEAFKYVSGTTGEQFMEEIEDILDNMLPRAKPSLQEQERLILLKLSQKVREETRKELKGNQTYTWKTFKETLIKNINFYKEMMEEFDESTPVSDSESLKPMETASISSTISDLAKAMNELRLSVAAIDKKVQQTQEIPSTNQRQPGAFNRGNFVQRPCYWCEGEHPRYRCEELQIAIREGLVVMGQDNKIYFPDEEGGLGSLVPLNTGRGGMRELVPGAAETLQRLRNTRSTQNRSFLVDRGNLSRNQTSGSAEQSRVSTYIKKREPADVLAEMERLRERESHETKSYSNFARGAFPDGFTGQWKVSESVSDEEDWEDPRVMPAGASTTQKKKEKRLEEHRKGILKTPSGNREERFKKREETKKTAEERNKGANQPEIAPQVSFGDKNIEIPNILELEDSDMEDIQPSHSMTEKSKKTVKSKLSVDEITPVKKKTPAFKKISAVEKPGDVSNVADLILTGDITIPTRTLLSVSSSVREEIQRMLTRRNVPIVTEDAPESDDEPELSIVQGKQLVAEIKDPNEIIKVLSVKDDYKVTYVKAGMVGNGDFRLSSTETTKPDGIYRSFYASPAIFVDAVFGVGNNQVWRAMIDNGCETVTISKSVAKAINAFVDTNHTWGMITANETRERYIGVIHDCKVTIGGISRLCQVWVQNLDSYSVLLGRTWQKAVCFQIMDDADGETWIFMKENPDGSGKRLEMRASAHDPEKDVTDIGLQLSQADQKRQTAVKSMVLLPDLTVDQEFGGSRIVEFDTEVETESDVKNCKTEQDFHVSGSTTAVGLEDEGEMPSRGVYSKETKNPQDKHSKTHFQPPLNKKQRKNLKFEEKKIYEKFGAVSIKINDSWFKIDGRKYKKAKDEVLRAVTIYEPNEKGAEFARTQERSEASVEIRAGKARGRPIPIEGSGRKYKPVGTKVRPVNESGKVPPAMQFGKSEEEIVAEIRKKKRNEANRITEERLAQMVIGKESENFLTSEESEYMKQIILYNDKAFAFTDAERGRVDPAIVPPAQIETVEHHPWNDRGPAYGQKETEIVFKVIREKMEAHVCEFSNSQYASRWFLLEKKRGGVFRWIQDFQKLNKVTVRDVGTVPNLDNMVERCGGRAIMSTIDMFSGYDEMGLDPKSRHLTAMHTPLGLVHMMVIPMGWTNSIAVFQRCMVLVLHKFIPDFVEVYLDDIPVLGPKSDDADWTEVMPGIRKCVKEHFDKVGEILYTIEKANMTASGIKSVFGVREVTLLGFLCTPEGIRPSPKKIEAIMNWPEDFEDPSDVRKFMGLIKYFRKGIKDLAKKAERIQRLTRKTIPWEWGEPEKETVQVLKAEFNEGGYLLKSPIWKDGEEYKFIIESDFSYMGWGGHLCQRQGTVEGTATVRFASGVVDSTQRNYSQVKGELWAVCKNLKELRHYVYGRQFILRVDSTGVAGMLNSHSVLDPTIGRWLGFVTLFDFVVERIAGKHNVVADAFSRAVKPVSDIHEYVIGKDNGADDFDEFLFIGTKVNSGSRISEEVIEIHESEVWEFNEKEYEGDLLKIGRFLQCGKNVDNLDVKEFQSIRKRARQYFIREGLLFRRPKKYWQVPKRVIGVESQKWEVIAEMHDGVIGGHRGLTATLWKCRRCYWWPNMEEMVEKWVKTCDACQRRSPKRFQDRLYPTLVHTLAWDIYVDTLHLGKSGGYEYAVGARCGLSGYIDGEPLRDKAASGVARFLFRWITTYGLPLGRFIFDNGHELIAAEVQDVLKKMGVVTSCASVGHPDGNSVIERGWQPLRQALVKWCETNQKLWHKYFRYALWADNVTVRVSTGYAPFTLWYGRECPLPIEFKHETWEKAQWKYPMDREAILEARIAQLAASEERVIDAAEKVNRGRLLGMDRWNEQNNERLVPLKVGDIVLLWDYTLENQHGRKFEYRWKGGPYIIYKLGDRNTAYIAELDGSKFSQPVTTSRLVLYKQRDPKLKKFEIHLSSLRNQSTTSLTQYAPDGGLSGEEISLVQRSTVIGMFVGNWSGFAGQGQVDGDVFGKI